MGRMLESLKLGSPRQGSKESHFFEDAIERDPPISGFEAEGVPFIEVGPNKSLDASPDVLAIVHPPAPQKTQPPHQPLEKMARVVLPDTLFPCPMKVALETWPTAPLSSGLAPDIIAFHQPEHPVSQQYAQLLESMMEGTPRPGNLLFLGGRSSVGTTTVVLNLAVLAATLGKGKIAVVDGHFRKPTIAQRLGLSGSAGVQEVLAGKLALDQAVVKTSIANLHLLAAQPGILPTPEALRWVNSWLRERYDWILVDGPAGEAEKEWSGLVPASDAVYLVLPQGEKPVRPLVQTLLGQGCKLRGVVHTEFE